MLKVQLEKFEKMPTGQPPVRSLNGWLEIIFVEKISSQQHKN